MKGLVKHGKKLGFYSKFIEWVASEDFYGIKRIQCNL